MDALYTQEAARKINFFFFFMFGCGVIYIISLYFGHLNIQGYYVKCAILALQNLSEGLDLFS